MLQYKQFFIKALAFLTGTPDALHSPGIELAEVNIMGSDFFFFVDLELRKIVAYFSFFKAFCPAFPYLIDSSPPIVTDSWVPWLPRSQNFQSIFRSRPSRPPSRLSQCTLIMLLLVTTDHVGSKILALISKKVKDISH